MSMEYAIERSDDIVNVIGIWGMKMSIKLGVTEGKRKIRKKKRRFGEGIPYRCRKQHLQSCFTEQEMKRWFFKFLLFFKEKPNDVGSGRPEDTFVF